MIDTTVLEAWCFYALQDSDDDELGESRKLMAADIMAVVAELKAAREVVRLARELHCREAMDMDVEGHDALDEAIEKYDEACHGNV